ncbi:chaperone modulator CbpM [Ulvibacter antarcticus]|uniref:MerR-like DNA binding protein n=1 Tax=Ulvibacter antarcticus TaxID=442714 RepID=A0A3L9YEI7_9FLAO|nr:chaperone modulator CbpM [Ulvibacter antarcticus]RMA58794.1 MerR-like DNA binding protein [Ulvibacter antarcticus]
MMDTQEYISIKHICSLYNIETTFVSSLNELELVELTYRQQEYFVHRDNIHKVERMIRIHRDLHINPEGIDVVLNLLEKVEAMQRETNKLKNRLSLYENE